MKKEHEYVIVLNNFVDTLRKLKLYKGYEIWADDTDFRFIDRNMGTSIFGGDSK